MSKDFEFDKDKDGVPSNWFKFEKVGDELVGTLISKHSCLNQLTDKDQIIYEIMDKNGDCWNVGGKAGIDAQMKNIKIGQIISLWFKEEKPSQKKGYHPTKIIKVLTKGTMNDEWIAQKKAESEEQASIGDPFGLN